jgi:hypothetical protein
MLQRAKCFVGWYEHAEVLLGPNHVTEIPTWSGATQRHRSLHVASFNIDAAIGPAAVISNPIQAGLTAGTNFHFVNNAQTFDPSDDFLFALEREKRKTTIVMGYSAKRLPGPEA